MDNSEERNYMVNDNLIKKERRALRRTIIDLIVFSLIAIITFVNFRRIDILVNMFDGAVGTIQQVVLYLFYFAIVIISLYFLACLIYIIYMKYKKNEWYSKIVRLNAVLDFPLFICKCIAILFFILINLFTPCTVSGQSMYPTFHDRDKLICINTFNDVKRDTVVVFDATNYSSNGNLYIKRAVAVGGDIVSYDDGTLYVNGVMEDFQNVSYYDYLYMYNSYRKIKKIDDATPNNSFKVPKGYAMCLGDNRNNSLDSRELGLINVKDIYGRIVLRFTRKISFF